MESHKIKTFEVNGLFGYYNHKISFFDSGITIIIGDNGIGKTYLLNMIHRFFSLEWGYFINLIFDDILITFQSGKILKINISEKNIQLRLYENEEYYRQDGITFSEESNILEKYELDVALLDGDPDSPEQINYVAGEIGRLLPNIEKINAFMYIDNTGRKYNRKELVAEFKDHIVFHSIYNKVEPGAPWLTPLIENNKTDFIEAQRLYQFKLDTSIAVETIRQQANNLKEVIGEKDRQYNTMSIELDSKFVFDLVSRIASEETSHENLLGSFNHLNQNKEKFEKIGLLDSKTDPHRDITKEEIDKSKEAIALYIENTQKKLDVYTDLYERMFLFKNLIDRRFKHKELFYNKEYGFDIKVKYGDVNESIPVTSLSSGEKNEFILYFNLIFGEVQNSIILIDEPEISLHIKWQEYFLKDLREILDKRKTRLLIATHSPDIIQDNWDIVNDLSKGDR